MRSTKIQRDVASNQRTPLTESVTPYVSESTESPNQTRLLQNYPNPFNPRTIIRFVVARPEYVKIAVSDGLGRMAGCL